MDWIIRNTKKLRCHTNLNNLLNSNWIELSEYDWFMSNLDVINYADYDGIELPIDFRDDYFLPTANDFETIIKSDLQVIWGVIAAVPKDEQPIFDKINFPFVEGNEAVWDENYFQLQNSIVEITAWDSSYTIVRFRDEKLSEKFRNYFDEAIELNEYKFK